jgi:hypothetical protein
MMKRIAILLSLGLLVGLLIALAPTPRAGAETTIAVIDEATLRGK